VCPARLPIRPILGFWRSKVHKNVTFPAQDANERAKFDAASFILGGEIRNRTTSCIILGGEIRNRTTSCIIYQTYKSALSRTVSTAQIAPKICQGQPPTFGSHFPDFTQIGSLLAEL